MSSTTYQPRKLFLLTYPRTASNLLIQILNLKEQPSILLNAKSEYFFAPTMRWRLGPSKLGGKNLNQWTPEERTGMAASYQTCFDNLEKVFGEAELQGKDLYIKEHVPWIIEPVAETKWVFGEYSTDEESWTITTKDLVSPEDITVHSQGNETVFLDATLKTWLPTFLIRHPALVFPSNYRTSIDLEGVEATKIEPYHAIEMTMHWSRTLYDWYTQQSPPSTPSSQIFPVILDADDIMTTPSLMLSYGKIIGLDPSKMKFSWTPMAEGELEKMSAPERRMRSTIAASSGIVKGKTSEDLDIDIEAGKWREEFGEEEGRKMEKWVRAAMPDYEYMRARRFRGDL